MVVARLGFAIGLMCLACTGAPASAQPTEALCARLAVPEGLELDCLLESDAASSGLAAVVRPTDSEFAPLSELRLRRVEEAIEDPAAWLREQLTLDLTPLDAALNELIQGPDSPITGTPLADQLQSWRGLLGSAATLPLAGCRDPVRLARDETWEMVCEWELGLLRQFMRFRLIERDGERYVIRIRTMNEQRLRHLVAIANSF
jgi:hypothetical protein